GRSFLGSCADLFIHHGLYARDALLDLAEVRGLHGLAARRLHAQAELLAAQLDQFALEGRGIFTAQIFGAHQRTCRFTNMVDTESLALARRNASRAVASSTPSISNNTLPGSTLATQYSTLPLPEPMRTSRGFFDTGTSGNTRFHTWPPRLTYLVMARRAASISRAVMRARLVDFKPYSPKDTLLPRWARPVFVPLNCLRYLVRLGWSMDIVFLP